MSPCWSTVETMDRRRVPKGWVIDEFLVERVVQEFLVDVSHEVDEAFCWGHSMAS